MRRLVLLVPLLVLAIACTDEDASDTVVQGATTSSTTPGSSTSSTSTGPDGTTPTTAFDGATTPTSVASTAGAVALLTGVSVTDGVTFTFRDEVPGVEVQYVQPPITADASGEEVHVEGGAFLQVRFEPASSYDMDAGASTYDGPDRIAGGGVVTEVVRTGDFEANLTWVIGVERETPFRVEIDGATVRVVIAS